MRIYQIEPAVRVLGPGVRFGLWLQGCQFRCPGCLAPNSWDLKGGREIGVEEVARQILKAPKITGITISGGEPLLQRRELEELLEIVLSSRPDLNTILYTGYRWEELLQLSGIAPLLRWIDLIIDGEYRRELNRGTPFRGSENQRFIPLSVTGAQLLHQMGLLSTPHPPREVELFFRGKELFIAGIPPVGFQLPSGGRSAPEGHLNLEKKGG
ncbi:MAG: 4Fe-4S single cluster domain-containing protein [Campylobacterales bacterium]